MFFSIDRVNLRFLLKTATGTNSLRDLGAVAVAQLVEGLLSTPEARGSNPNISKLSLPIVKFN